jgi:hypothetical protein
MESHIRRYQQSDAIEGPATHSTQLHAIKDAHRTPTHIKVIATNSDQKVGCWLTHRTHQLISDTL